MPPAARLDPKLTDKSLRYKRVPFQWWPNSFHLIRRANRTSGFGPDFTSPASALIFQVPRRLASITSSNAVSGYTIIITSDRTGTRVATGADR
jgi:hypothetical protein